MIRQARVLAVCFLALVVVLGGCAPAAAPTPTPAPAKPAPAPTAAPAKPAAPAPTAAPAKPAAPAPTAAPAKPAAKADTPVTIRYAWTQPGHHVSKQSAALTKRIEEFSGGSIKVEAFPDGQLYDDRKVIQPTLTGAIDMSDFVLARWVEMIPVSNMMEIPFAVKDKDHLQRALKGGLHDLLVKEIEPKGAKILGYMNLQASGVLITRNKAIQKPADLQGLKMRTPSPIGAEMFKSWGAQPVVIGAADVYLALQRGTIDGLNTSPTAVRQFKWNEVVKNATVLVYQGALPFSIVMNANTWQKLSPKQQDAVQRAVDIASETTFKDSVPDFEISVDNIKQDGIQVYRIPDNQMPDWIKPTASIREDFIKKTGDVGKRAFDILDKTR